MRLVRVSRWSSFSCCSIALQQNPNILIVTYIMPANGQNTRVALPDTLLCDSQRLPALCGFPAKNWFARGGDFVESADACGMRSGFHQIRRGVGFGGDGSHRVNEKVAFLL